MHNAVPANFSSQQATNGFSLIELMISVAIVGVLASIAYPYYGDFVQKTRRTDAQLALLEQVQAMERCKATNYSFTGCTLSSTTSPEGHYTLTLTSTASSYTIEADGIGVQAQDTECNNMSINNLGVRTPDASADCWPD